MPKRNGSGLALLADPVRRQIIAIVALRTRAPARIAEEIGLSRSATSRQLRLLREAGLVRASRSSIDGRTTDYTIAPEASGRILAWLVLTEPGRTDEGAWPAIGRDPRPTVELRGLARRNRVSTLEVLAERERQAAAAAARRREDRARPRDDPDADDDS